MKKLLIKREVIVQEYQPSIPGVQAQPEKWVKGEEVLFEAPADLTDYVYHPAINGVEAVAEVPEIKEWQVIDQTQGQESELEVWLAGNLHKYPEGFVTEYIDISAEIEAQAKLQQAMDEISKGIKGIAIFKVKAKEKQLTSSQIAQLFSSSEIKLIIETLSTGSLPLASALISAYQADGVIVTEEDKQAVLQAIA